MDSGSPTNAALIACRWAATLADLGRHKEAIVVADEFIALAGSWDLEPRYELGAIRAWSMAGSPHQRSGGRDRAQRGHGSPDRIRVSISAT